MMTIIDMDLIGVSHKHVVEDESGQRWVYKTGRDGRCEFIGASIAHLFGVKTPDVMLTEDTWCTSCDDEGAYIRWVPSSFKPAADEDIRFMDDAAIRNRMMQGLLLACFDAAIDNGDRHDMNWMANTKTGDVIAIDNAYGRDSDSVTTRSTPEAAILYTVRRPRMHAFPIIQRAADMMTEDFIKDAEAKFMSLASTAPVGVGETLMTFALNIRKALQSFCNQTNGYTGLPLDAPAHLQPDYSTLVREASDVEVQGVKCTIWAVDGHHVAQFNDYGTITFRLITWNEYRAGFEWAGNRTYEARDNEPTGSLVFRAIEAGWA